MSSRTLAVADAEPSANWALDMLPNYTDNWETDHMYRIVSYAKDSAGNLDVAFTTTTFTFDKTPPLTVISTPSFDGEGFNGTSKPLNAIAGVVSDASSGVAELTVSLFMDENANGACDPTLDKYWDWNAKVWGPTADCAVKSTT